MRHSHPKRLDLENYSFRRDVERIKDNYDTLYALERKLNYYLDTPNNDRYPKITRSTMRSAHRSRSNSSSPSRRESKRVNWTDLAESTAKKNRDSCNCGNALCDCCSLLYRSSVGINSKLQPQGAKGAYENKSKVLQDKIDTYKAQNKFFSEKKQSPLKSRPILKSTSVRSQSASRERPKERPRSRTPSPLQKKITGAISHDKCTVPGCCYNDSGSSVRLTTESSRLGQSVTSRVIPAPRYDAIYDKHNRRPEYNYLGLEKPLAAEIVDMAKKFDKEKQDLLDLVQLQQRVITKMTPPGCYCSHLHVCRLCSKAEHVSSRRNTHSFVEKRVPTEASRPSSPGPLGHYTMQARDRIDHLLRNR